MFLLQPNVAPARMGAKIFLTEYGTKMKKNAAYLLALSLLASLVSTGCGKQESTNAKTESAQTASAQTNPNQQPKLSKPDLSTPTSAYREMKYSEDTIFAYYAIYPKEANFGNIARTLSKKYSDETDGFKKQDIVTGLKGEMEEGLKKAKENKYYFMNFPTRLMYTGGLMDIRAYDFQKKSFTNPQLGICQGSFCSTGDPRFSFPNRDGHSDYGAGGAMQFSNRQQFADVKVEDQEVARKMEGLRGAKKLGMIVYFYANDIVPDRDDYQELRPQITKVEYVDPAGNVVFTQVE